jgi:actin related protein 2/3 complex, subunit 2
MCSFDFIPLSLLNICRPSSVDVQFVDFDGVRFHLSTPSSDRKTLLLLSMHIRCWNELVNYGAMDILKREYGALVAAQPEPEYNVSLEIDLDHVPTDLGAFPPSNYW